MNVGMDGGTTGTPAVCNLPAREASCNGDDVIQQDNIVPNINMDVGMDGGAATAGEPSVRHLPAQEASRNGDGVV